jgi:formyltetrahydrofolate-dependent phosphoribosylglycinamide formyltransferase
MGHKIPVAVLISGTGTNMAALIYAAKHPDCPYEIVLVASNNPDAPGLNLARAEGIVTFAHAHTGMKRAAFDAILDTQVRRSGAQFIALAGYMRLLSPGFIADWQGRIVNIHPSLLPAHKGLHTHEAVIAADERVTGCTVHVVTEALDDGPVLGQTEVAVVDGDTPDTLAARVLIAEHQLYSRCLAAFVAAATGPEALIAQVRARAMTFPEADEVTSHGMPCFGIIKGKKFAYVSNDHHGDGKIALLVKISGVEEQATLIENDPDRYYRPAYFGDGWVGIRLDLGDNDWDHINDWLGRSWRAVAPPRLSRLMSVADAF